jgi:L-ascorbate metabolism protein UlaG (beta-lactamase superfamily)
LGDKNFAGTDIYAVEDFPEIDLLIITHDHYDHLDYETMLKLVGKTKKICTSLGVGAHLAHWGFDESIISELDWWESIKIDSSMEITATPARHFSGRGLVRGKTFWSSFVLQTTDYKIFIGGDSGYDTHFREIGERFGGFDLAILECGQYNDFWANIHTMPEEVVQVAKDINAKVLMPVHWGKFTLSLHAWDEPITRVSTKANAFNQAMTTPMIGEIVTIDSIYPTKKWW